MESFTDGFGAWKFLPGGGHLMDQDEAMIDDLMQWKFIEAVLQKQAQKQERESHDGQSA